MKHKMQILQEAARRAGPLCIGLDTDSSYIPQNILKNFPSPAAAVLAYNKAIVERVARDKSACCFKIQVAYYEAMGLQGMEAFAQTLQVVRDAGFVAISDIKRGDIAASAQAYARAHFSGDFETDIITVNPYMGFDTLEPFTQMCVSQKKGVFVLLRTSNPGASDIEQKELSQGGRVLDCVGAELNRILKNTESDFPEQTCSCVGAVVGCTHKDDAEFLRKAYPKIFFLIPGYGAQGGDAEICATLLQEAGGVVNSSRGILCAYKKDSSLAEKMAAASLTMEDIAESAARAAIASKKDLTRFV
ncbi:MAG: orotidine-5'-phosphate decarboxylase [Treponema sp.]|nr:orotidine-5'-phosphate decarboxylase [Treponema sp.]